MEGAGKGLIWSDGDFPFERQVVLALEMDVAEGNDASLAVEDGAGIALEDRTFEPWVVEGLAETKEEGESLDFDAGGRRGAEGDVELRGGLVGGEKGKIIGFRQRQGIDLSRDQTSQVGAGKSRELEAVHAHGQGRELLGLVGRDAAGQIERPAVVGLVEDAQTDDVGLLPAEDDEGAVQPELRPAGNGEAALIEAELRAAVDIAGCQRGLALEQLDRGGGGLA